MNLAKHIEEKHLEALESYWHSRGIRIKAKIVGFKDEAREYYHCLRSDLVMSVPGITQDNKISGKIFGEKAEILPKFRRRMAE